MSILPPPPQGKSCFRFRRGGGGAIERPEIWGGGGAQLMDTIVTIENKLRSHFWQGLCTSDFVPLLGISKMAGVGYVTILPTCAPPRRQA